MDGRLTINDQKSSFALKAQKANFEQLQIKIILRIFFYFILIYLRNQIQLKKIDFNLLIHSQFFMFSTLNNNFETEIVKPNIVLQNIKMYIYTCQYQVVHFLFVYDCEVLGIFAQTYVIIRCTSFCTFVKFQKLLRVQSTFLDGRTFRHFLCPFTQSWIVL